MKTPKTHNRVIAINPVSRGFGFAVLEANPVLLRDWGLRLCNRKKRMDCLRKVAVLLDLYKPSAIAIEDWTTNRQRDAKKSVGFYRGLLRLAQSRKPKIEVIPFFNGHIRGVFRQQGANNKDEISELIARRFPELSRQLPRPRQGFLAESYSMSFFYAVALALTWLERGTRKESKDPA